MELINNRFMHKLKDCYAVRLIRQLVISAEIGAAHGSDGPGTLYPFSGVGDLSNIPNHPTNRGIRPTGLGVRNLPSLLLLPEAFTIGQSEYNRIKSGQYSSETIAGKNSHTQDDFLNFVSNAALGRISKDELDKLKESAFVEKLGTPSNTSATMFSKEEVLQMENLLEAEHLPFYFHDLRTNEIVSFHAFLNSLSDSFSPSYSASSGFGRVEDVQIYQKTSRSIALDFTVMSMAKEDMKEMYFKLNKIVAMCYPQYSRGTLLETTGDHGTTTFVQPFSQITTATPLIRLRVGDLIKSNYSREGLSRLMGIDAPEFGINVGDGNDQRYAKQQEYNKQIQKASAAFGERLDFCIKVAKNESLEGIQQLAESGVLTEGSTALPQAGSIVAVNLTRIAGQAIMQLAEENPFPNIPGVNPNINVLAITPEFIKRNHDFVYKEADTVFVEIVSYALSAASYEAGPLIMQVKESTNVSNPIATSFDKFNIAQWVKGDLDQDYNDSIFLPVGLIDPEMTLAASNFEGFNDNEVPKPEGGRPDANIDADVKADSAELMASIFGENNPLFRAFESTVGRGLAGVITSLNFDWGLNSEIMWDLKSFNHKAPMGCKVSIAFTPIHDITPGLDHNGMLRAPVFNVGNASPHQFDDPHDDFEGRKAQFDRANSQAVSVRKKK